MIESPNFPLFCYMQKFPAFPNFLSNMQSILFMLTVCEAISHASAVSATSSCDADGSSLLQARSLIRKVAQLEPAASADRASQVNDNVLLQGSLKRKAQRTPTQTFTPFLNAALTDVQSLAADALVLAREARAAVVAAVDPKRTDGADTDQVLCGAPGPTLRSTS